MTEYKRWQLRSKDNFLKYLKIEIELLKREWKVLLPCVIMQYVHAIFHNLAYWIQDHKLSVEQRFELYDLGYALIGELSKSSSHWSDYLVFGAIFFPVIVLVLTIPIFRQNPEKPRYMVIILKRVLLHISIALVFRIISFLITTLPAPARQCRLNFDPTCKAEYPDDPERCVIPNPEFKPPSGSEFFTRLDALNGCGDLMFSSHTIYTVSLILTVMKYWWNKYTFALLVLVQIVIAVLIVAARKHYSLDVFSALYIVPLLWFTHDAYWLDINSKETSVTPKTMYEFYQIDVSPDLEIEPVNIQKDEELGVEPSTPETTSPLAKFERKDSM